MTSLIFFQFLTDLEQSGSRIPSAWSVKLTFPLIVTFYPTKTENKTEKSLKQFSDFLQKNADISKIKEVLVLNLFFFMKLHMCVYLRSKFQASSIILKSFRQGGAILSSHRQTRLKNPPRLGLQQIKWFHFCRLHTFVQSISGQCTHFIPQGFLLLSRCIICYPKMG